MKGHRDHPRENMSGVGQGSGYQCSLIPAAGRTNVTSNLLITEAHLTDFDQKRLYTIYQKWPQYFIDAAKISCSISHDPDFYESVLLCGMGGSATGCDIINNLMQSYSCIPSSVVRGHSLPTYTNKHSLVIINSVSGNTQEAISMMEQALDKNAEIFCISSGGILQQKAKLTGNKHIRIPNIGLPRASLPYLIMPAIKLISPFLKRSIKEEIASIPRSLSAIARDISVTVSDESNIAKKIASFLNSTFAFCFTSPQLVSVGNRFKNSLNENAKVHCINESILEASHNAIVPFTFNGDRDNTNSNNSNIHNTFVPKVLLLTCNNDRILVKERFDKVISFFTEMGQSLMRVNMSDNSLITAIISSVYILDFSTIYMAISRRIDPSPTPAIDILKEK
jgi:glucose/mannose-6-phosphate isomerase